MAVRRAFDFNDALLDALASEKTVDGVKKAGRYLMLTDKRLRDIFDQTSPEFRHLDAWAWAVDHWYNGGLRRSVEVTMSGNMNDKNVEAIKGKVNDLYSG